MSGSSLIPDPGQKWRDGDWPDPVYWKDKEIPVLPPFKPNESNFDRLMHFGAYRNTQYIRDVEEAIQKHSQSGGGASQAAFKERLIKINQIVQFIFFLGLGAAVAFGPAWVGWGIGLPAWAIIGLGGGYLSLKWQYEADELKREDLFNQLFKGMLDQHSFSCNLPNNEWNLPTFSSIHPIGEDSLPPLHPSLKSDVVMKKELEKRHPEGTKDLERVVSTYDLEVSLELKRQACSTLARTEHEDGWKKVQNLVRAANTALEAGRVDEYEKKMTEAKREGLLANGGRLGEALAPLSETEKIQTFEFIEALLPLSEPRQKLQQAEKMYEEFCISPGKMIDEVYAVFWHPLGLPYPHPEMDLSQKRDQLFRCALIDRQELQVDWNRLVEEFGKISQACRTFFPLPDNLPIETILSGLEREHLLFKIAQFLQSVRNFSDNFQEALLRHPQLKLSAPPIQGHKKYESFERKLQAARSKMLKVSTVDALVRWQRADPSRQGLSIQEALSQLPSDKRRRAFESWLKANPDMQNETVKHFLAFLPHQEIYEGLKRWVMEHPTGGGQDLNTLLTLLPPSLFRDHLQSWVHANPQLGPASIQSTLNYLPPYPLQLDLRGWVDAFPRLKEVSLRAMGAVLKYRTMQGELQSFLQTYPDRNATVATAFPHASESLRGKLALWTEVYPQIAHVSLQTALNWVSVMGIRDELEGWMNMHFDMRHASIIRVLSRGRELEVKVAEVEAKLEGIKQEVVRLLATGMEENPEVWKGINHRLTTLNQEVLVPLLGTVGLWEGNSFRKAYNIYKLSIPTKPFEEVEFSKEDTPYQRHLKIEKRRYNKLLQKVDSQMLFSYLASVYGKFAFSIIELVALIVMTIFLSSHPWAVWGISAALSLAPLSLFYFHHRLKIQDHDKQALKIAQLLQNHTEIKHIPGNRPELLELAKVQGKWHLDRVQCTEGEILMKGTQPLPSSLPAEPYLRRKCTELDNFLKLNPQIVEHEQHYYNYLQQELTRIEGQEQAAQHDFERFKQDLANAWHQLNNQLNQLDQLLASRPDLARDRGDERHSLQRAFTWIDTLWQASASQEGLVAVTRVIQGKKGELQLQMERLHIVRRNALQQALERIPSKEDQPFKEPFAQWVGASCQRQEEQLDRYDASQTRNLQERAFFKKVKRKMESFKRLIDEDIKLEWRMGYKERRLWIQAFIKETLAERYEEVWRNPIDLAALIERMLKTLRSIQKGNTPELIAELENQKQWLKQAPTADLIKMLDVLEGEIKKTQKPILKQERARALLLNLNTQYEGVESVTAYLKACKQMNKRLKFFIRKQETLIQGLQQLTTLLRHKPDAAQRLEYYGRPLIEVQEMVINTMRTWQPEQVLGENPDLNTIIEGKRSGQTPTEESSRMQKYNEFLLEKASWEYLEWAFNHLDGRLTDLMRVESHYNHPI